MSASTMPSAARGSALGRLTLTELKLMGRERSRFFVRLAVPVVLLVIFGAIPFYTQKHAYLDGYSLLDAYVPILVAYSVAMLSLTGLPTVLANYRERGVLRRMRTTPAGPVRVLSAQLIAYAVAMVAMIIVVLAVARVGYGVFFPRQLAGFALAAVLGAAAMLALGLLIAAVARTSQAAQSIGILVLFPLMFFAGLFFPIPVMPTFLRHLSHATPLGAAVQAMQDAWLGHWPHPLQLVTMAAWAAACAIAAAIAFRWE